MSAEYNFNYPLDLGKLQNERLKLVAFDSDLPTFSHLYARTTTASETALNNFAYLPYGPFSSASEFQAWYVPTIQQKDNVVWFAILVRQGADGGGGGGGAKKEDEGAVEVGGERYGFAGSIAYLNADPANASCEIGHINILPAYQRTFVTTNAVGLLLLYLLDPEPQGLHLRRAQWFANASNARSRTAAERLGFKFEGVLRWHRVIPEGKASVEGEQAGDGRGAARHSVLLGLCWDDWRDGAREKLAGLMAR